MLSQPIILDWVQHTMYSCSPRVLHYQDYSVDREYTWRTCVSDYQEYRQIMGTKGVSLSREYCIHRLWGEQESDYQEATVYTDYEENKESQIIKRLLYTQTMRRTRRVRLSREYCIHRLWGEQESDYQEATVYTDYEENKESQIIKRLLYTQIYEGEKVSQIIKRNIVQTATRRSQKQNDVCYSLENLCRP